MSFLGVFYSPDLLFFTHFSSISYLLKHIEHNYFTLFLVIPISDSFIGLVLLPVVSADSLTVPCFLLCSAIFD